MHTDGESWNPTSQSWKGGQNPLTQLNQLQHESLSPSTDTLAEIICALEATASASGQQQPSEHPWSLAEHPYQIQMLFPKVVEEALLCSWVSLTPD